MLVLVTGFTACSSGSDAPISSTSPPGLAGTKGVTEQSVEAPSTSTAAPETTVARAITPGVTDRSIAVVGLASLTHPTGSAHELADLGARARFRRANADGGVHGRTVDLVEVIDDRGDSVRAGDAIERIASEQRYFAVVPLVSTALAPSQVAPLQQAGIPYVGWGPTPGFCHDPFGFGVTGCIEQPLGSQGITADALASSAFVDAVAQQVLVGPEASAPTAAIVGDTVSPASEVAIARLADMVVEAGFEVVLVDGGLPTTPRFDYSPWASRVMTSAGGAPPAVVFHLGQPASVVGLSRALAELEYPGIQVNPSTHDPAYVTNYALRLPLLGSLVATPFSPVQDTGNPAVAQMVADLRALGADDAVIGRPAVAAGYWSADLFLAILQRAGPEPTAASFTQGASGLSYPFAGVGPSTWPANHDAPVACTSLLRVAEETVTQGSITLVVGRFEVVSPLTCVE